MDCAYGCGLTPIPAIHGVCSLPVDEARIGKVLKSMEDVAVAGRVQRRREEVKKRSAAELADALRKTGLGGPSDDEKADENAKPPNKCASHPERSGFYFCKQCGAYMCYQCEYNVHNFPGAANHERVFWEDVVVGVGAECGGRKCGEHENEVISLFCMDCEQAICLQCVSEHGGHRTCTLSQAVTLLLKKSGSSSFADLEEELADKSQSWLKNAAQIERDFQHVVTTSRFEESRLVCMVHAYFDEVRRRARDRRKDELAACCSSGRDAAVHLAKVRAHRAWLGHLMQLENRKCGLGLVWCGVVWCGVGIAMC